MPTSVKGAMRERALQSLRRTAAGYFLFAAACNAQVERTPVGPGTDTTGGGPARATLAVTPQFEVRDSAIVRLLGGAAQTAAGATVRLQRTGSATVTTATLDATGSFVGTGLLEGEYELSIQRVLTASERTELSAVAPDADAFVAAARFTVSAPHTARHPVASFGRRGSLILSEVNHSNPYDPSTGAEYLNGHYVELYNNGDTTVFLDGITIARGYAASYNYPNFPCSLFESMTLDPSGIWARFMWQLPGTGATYPLQPGETAVFASDAIDHAAFVATAPDLRGARFEASQGVDNPAVPNATQVGLGTWDRYGGFHLPDVVKAVVLTRRLDVARLDQRNVTGTESYTMARIPADSILDVMTTATVLPLEYSRCPGPLAERFERQLVSVIQAVDSLTLQRRVLYTRDGRKVLQRTGASAADFEARLATPGTVP